MGFLSRKYVRGIASFPGGPSALLCGWVLEQLSNGSAVRTILGGTRMEGLCPEETRSSIPAPSISSSSGRLLGNMAHSNVAADTQFDPQQRGSHTFVILRKSNDMVGHLVLSISSQFRESAGCDPHARDVSCSTGPGIPCGPLFSSATCLYFGRFLRFSMHTLRNCSMANGSPSQGRVARTLNGK
jgi:hypothetical protein